MDPPPPVNSFFISWPAVTSWFRRSLPRGTAGGAPIIHATSSLARSSSSNSARALSRAARFRASSASWLAMAARRRATAVLLASTTLGTGVTTPYLWRRSPTSSARSLSSRISVAMRWRVGSVRTSSGTRPKDASRPAPAAGWLAPNVWT